MTREELPEIIQKVKNTTNPTEPELVTQFGLIDHTTLSNYGTEATVAEFCEKVVSFDHATYGLPPLPAVCVWPQYAKIASKILQDSPTVVACVAGAFPSGQTSLEIKKAEVNEALINGAEEIDIVINRGKAHEKNFDTIEHEIREIKNLCGDRKLKVILETGEFSSLKLLEQTCDAVLRGGADFLKTSTGKSPEGATLEKAAILMLSTKKYREQTGEKKGVKISGGVKTCLSAAQYIALHVEISGWDIATSDDFRIGAGSYVPVLLNTLKKVKNHPWG